MAPLNAPAANKAPAKPTTPAGSKSGLKVFKAGDILFNQNDKAESLYIIQKGQIRLFLPKGRGFVELGVLRSGEVIGEMAYFDEKSRSRSCSAEAIVQTEVIEISFNAFGKTMEGLNPWFKTIINTLANRLRKTNDKVRELESNSIGFSGGKVADYKFFNNAEIVKLLSLLYMVIRSHGVIKESRIVLDRKTLKFYCQEIFSLQDVKIEEFIGLITNLGYMEIMKDQDNMPNVLVFKDADIFRALMGYVNTQRNTADEKKINISFKCEHILKKILEQLEGKGFQGDDIQADFGAILLEAKDKKIAIAAEDIKDAVDSDLVRDIIVGSENRLIVPVNYDKLKKTYPMIRFVNAIKKLNEQKDLMNKY